MSSILTNNGAMVALSTLRSINKDMSTVQSQISTGKKVATAKDNAATWAISAVMKSDVTGFKAITDTLSLGSSTLNVARNGAEAVNGLLDDLKGRIISAQEENVDRGKINTDAKELRANIEATVEASQFNGLNMLKGDPTEASVNVLGSLDRDSAGNVTVANISVDRQSLETADGASTDTTISAGDAAATETVFTVADYTEYAVGDTVAIQLTDANGEGTMVQYAVTADDLDAAKTAAAGGAAADGNNSLAGAIGAGLAAAFSADDLTDAFTIGATAGAANVELTFAAPATVDTEVKAVKGGGLAALSLIDVSTEGGAKAALSAIEGLTQTSIDAAAAFGSSAKRVDTQMDFLKNLTDSLNSGIGALVDADMEETSARLQALQVQQQLGVQALSIANQQPQSLMSLFR